MAENRVLEKAEQLGKIAALTAVVLYAAGFLIVSIYFSSLGISLPFTLRPRMVSAGLLFLSMVAVAYYIGSLASQKDLFDSVCPGHTRSLRVLSRFTLVALLSIWVSLLLRSTTDLKTISWWSFLLFALLPTALAIIALIQWNARVPVRRRLISAFVLLGLCWISLLASLVHKRGFEMFGLLSVWLFLVGASVAGFDRSIENRFSPLVQIGGQIPIALTLVVFFSVSIFPHFLQQWGGSAPMPVTVTFSKDGGYLAGSVRATLLVDESELGLYVTDPTLRASFFIPRSAIVLVRFTEQ